jgi:hypothetical protein
MELFASQQFILRCNENWVNSFSPGAEELAPAEWQEFCWLWQEKRGQSVLIAEPW